MSKQLKLGKMTNQELAEWFGITKDYFAHHKKDLIEKMAPFCKCENLPSGGVVVTEIYHSVYVKYLEEMEHLLEEVRLSNGGLCSAAGIARALHTKGFFKDVELKILKYRINVMKKVAFDGENFGTCYLKLAILQNKFTNKYRELTDEEMFKYKELREIQAKNSKKDSFDEERAQFEDDELDLTKLADQAKIQLYPTIRNYFSDVLGLTIVRATQFELFDQYK